MKEEKEGWGILTQHDKWLGDGDEYQDRQRPRRSPEIEMEKNINTRSNWQEGREIGKMRLYGRRRFQVGTSDIQLSTPWENSPKDSVVIVKRCKTDHDGELSDLCISSLSIRSHESMIRDPFICLRFDWCWSIGDAKFPRVAFRTAIGFVGMGFVGSG